MSKVQPVLLNRAKMCAELRSGKHQQCQETLGAYFHQTGPVCFAGLAYRVFNISHENDLERALGITHDIAQRLVDKNDRGYTFPMLADILETLPICEDA